VKLSAIALLYLALLAAPLVAEAQPGGKVARIGFLETGSLSANLRGRGSFQERLRELGYIEGRNVAFESRGADGKVDKLAGLATELIGLKVDVIVTVGSEAVLAAKQATSTIPIVMAIVSDPVGLGIIASLARPGGNITGVTDLDIEQIGKRLELLKELVPGLSRVALVWKTGHPKEQEALREAEAAARSLGIRLQRVGVRDPNEFQGAFSAMAREHVGAFLVVADTMFSTHRVHLVGLAAKGRLPAIFWRREFVEAGGLMSYGSSYSEQYRHAATYVDKILRGAKPADLPVEQPTKFELVISLKTAMALGLTIPPSVLARADEVIE
jgi:putative ABC transport system substrate-binding protein